MSHVNNHCLIFALFPQHLLARTPSFTIIAAPSPDHLDESGIAESLRHSLTPLSLEGHPLNANRSRKSSEHTLPRSVLSSASKSSVKFEVYYRWHYDVEIWCDRIVLLVEILVCFGRLQLLDCLEDCNISAQVMNCF